MPRIISIIALLALVGCAPAIQPGTHVEKAALQLAAGSGGPADDYRLHAGDVIELKFYYDDKLNEKTVIGPDGRISLQLVGEITAAGLTRRELKDVLVKEYTAKDKHNPEVAVVVREYAGQAVYIGGEVRAPGVLQTFGNLTALQAIFQSGGFTSLAEQRSVVVLRKQKNDMVAFMALDLAQDLSESGESKDIVLQPYDVVYVPKSRIARANQFVEQYIDKLLPFSRNIGFTWIKDLNGNTIRTGQ